MSKHEMEQLAERITDYLFENGQGQQAERLVLTDCDGNDLGGWSRRPVIDVIVRMIREVSDAH